MIWAVILTVFAASSNAYADDVSAPCIDVTFDMPDYILVESEGDGYMAFDLAGAQSIAVKLQCGEYHFRMRTALATELVNEQSKTRNLREQIALNLEKLDTLEYENDRLFRKWKDENKKRHEAENKADYAWIGWTAAAVLGASTLALGTVLVLK